MNLKNMRECDNSKIHLSNNSLLSICLLIMLETLLLVPSLHCNTLIHFTTLHQTTLHYTYRQFTSSEDETYLCYMRIQSVPRCKHFPLRLYKTNMLVMYKVKVALSSENHIRHISAM